VLDFLFSPNGGLLRQQLVDAAVDQVDSLAWRTTLRLGRRLPRRFQPPGLRGSPPRGRPAIPCSSLEPLRQLRPSCGTCPVSSPACCSAACPGCWGNGNCASMGVQLARGLAERGVVHLLRDLIVTPEANAGRRDGAS
jgi:hypothetical protein